MTIVRKKAWPELFEAIASGKKRGDLRLNDFEIAEGDTLVLEEWDPATKQYTGRKIEKRVTHVAKFGLDPVFLPEDKVRAQGLQLISLE